MEGYDGALLVTELAAGSVFTMFRDFHTLHGVLVGVGLYVTGIASMRTAVMVGAGAAAYMLTFGHELPFSM